MTEGACAPAQEIWVDLAVSMRTMRTGAGMSLRRAELESGVGRGTLSQVETAKARPNRGLVEWYDATLGGDGLLVAMFAEARGAHGPERLTRVAVRHDEVGDAATVHDPTLPHGTLVVPGSRLTAAWTLHNTGVVPWRGRRLSRVGPHAAPRLITSELWAPVPDCDPGERVVARVSFTVPATNSSYAAYWHLTDARGRATLALASTLSVILVGDEADGTG